MAEDVFGIVGSVIAGAYHVEAVIAEGGFGVVYRAHHGGFRAPVALKLLRVSPQGSAQQAAFLEMFRAEAELLFRLSASLPTVVRPLHVDAFTTAAGSFVPYIVLEWLEGVTLDALIKQRKRDGVPPLPLRRLFDLLTPVARALERAHNFSGPEGLVSIVHRDLKPENIFIARVANEEVVKILDFGIGKVKSVASQVAGRMSQDGQAPIAFTPAFGAPEQWAPKHFGQTGPWTDVWGLALCMVEALAARPVIDGEPPAMMGTALDPKRRPTPRNEGIDVSDAVEGVFARALALDPRARQRDAGVFWDELSAALQLPEADSGLALESEATADSRRAPRVDARELRARSSGSMARVPPSAAAQRALAMDLDNDLEFDPTSVPMRRGAVSETRPSTPPAASVAHFVPDLELTSPPVSSRSVGARPAASSSSSSSATQRAVREPDAHTSGAHVPVIDFDDADAGASLDLDLAPDEPLARRAASSPGMRAVQLPVNRISSPPPAPLSQARPALPEAPYPVSGVVPVRPLPAETTLSSLPIVERSQTQRGSVPPPAVGPGALETGSVAKIEPPAREEQPLMRRLRLALGLFGVSFSVALFDPLYAAVTGEKLEIFGARPSLFAGLLLLVALALAGREVFRES